MSGLREVVRFELRLHVRRVSTWVFAAALALTGAALVALMGNDIGSHANAPAAIGQYSFILGMIGLVVTAAFFGDAGSRDSLTRMLPIFYTMPLGKRDYFLGRFLGALIVNLLVLLAVPLGLAAGARSGLLDPALVGPHEVLPYARAYVLFVVPGLLVSASILYSTAALTRRALPVFLALVAIVAGYFGTIAIGELSLDIDLGPLLDPTGLVAVIRELRSWSPAEMNTRQLPFGGPLLWNRLLWMGAALLLLAATYRRFQFAHPEQGGRSRRAVNDPAGDLAHLAPISTEAAARAFGLRAQLAQAAAVARRSFGEISTSRDFQVVAIGLVVFILASGWTAGSDRFGTPAWPVTAVIGRYLASLGVGAIVTLITIFYAGELVWRERDTGVADIADAMPLPDWVPLAGKFGALTLMLLVIQGLLLLSGIALQALQGYFRFEPWLYVQILFGLKLADYVIFAGIALFLHTVIDQKYAAHAAAAGVFVGSTYASQFGARNHLVIPASDAGWLYSDISGFEPFLAAYLPMKLYWLAWTVVLALLTALLWVRGRERGLARRASALRARLTARVALALCGALLMVAASGGYIFWNTRVLNDFITPERWEARLAEYEKTYRHHRGRPQPRISAVSLQVELHPERRAARVQGTYLLHNRTAAPIDTVLLLLRDPFAFDSVAFDRGSTIASADPVHNTWVHALSAPLAPGDSIRLHFVVSMARRGFRNSGVVANVLGNGTYFERDHMPLLGYQRTNEIEDDEPRRRHGLAPRQRLAPASDSAGRWSTGSSFDSDKVSFEAVIGTAQDQLAVTSGVLQRTWVEDGRRYAHFRTPFPVAHTYAVLSARYERRVSEQRGIRVELLHHPEHDFNAQRMLDGADSALAYYEASFGRSPFREVRIAEFPRFGVYASAYPNLIAHSESFGFIARPDLDAGDLDTPLLVTAHELAHQWWGGLVSPANVMGRQVLTETLANYSTMMVLERLHGRRAVRTFLRQQQIEYLNRRGRGDMPLLESSDAANVHYRKGAVAMYALREYLGEGAVNAALASLVSRFRDAGAPYATAHDLRTELLAVTPDSLRYLLTDLLETVTIWDLRVLSATAVPVDSLVYDVTLEVEAAKFRVDSLFAHREVPMDDLVDIGVFDRRGTAADTALHLGKHRVRSGRQSITVRVSGLPARAGIDPHLVLIARRGDDLADNVRDVTVAPAAASRLP